MGDVKGLGIQATGSTLHLTGQGPSRIAAPQTTEQKRQGLYEMLRNKPGDAFADEFIKAMHDLDFSNPTYVSRVEVDINRLVRENKKFFGGNFDSAFSSLKLLSQNNGAETQDQRVIAQIVSGIMEGDYFFEGKLLKHKVFESPLGIQVLNAIKTEVQGWSFDNDFKEAYTEEIENRISEVIKKVATPK